MIPPDDATSSQRNKRRAESPEEDHNARESSRRRIDDPAEEPGRAQNMTVDDTYLSSDLVAPDVLSSRPLSPASLWRSWAQQSVASRDSQFNLLHQAHQQASRMMPANRAIIEPTSYNAGLLGRSHSLQPPRFVTTGGGLVTYAASLSRHPLSSSIEQLQPSEALRHGAPIDPITGGGFAPYAASRPLLPSIVQLQPSGALLHGAPMHWTQHLGSGRVLNPDHVMQANLHANLLGPLLAPPDHQQGDPIPQHSMSSVAASMSRQQGMGQGRTINDDLLLSSASIPRFSSGGFMPPVSGPFSANRAHVGVGPAGFSSFLGNPLLLSQHGWGAQGGLPGRMGEQGGPPGRMGAPGRHEEEQTSPVRILYLDRDSNSLSPYQCEIRKQIEVFAAQSVHVETNAQGRKKPIILGQVGIRCRHCAMLRPIDRSRGSTYFPSKLDGLYQAAQNLATFHLCRLCDHVPPQVRKEIIRLHEKRSSAGHGKQYWADALKELGVLEDGERGILVFASS